MPDERSSEERQPEGWPPYYLPRLVRALVGIGAVTGEAVAIERGYVLHRSKDVECRVIPTVLSSEPE